MDCTNKGLKIIYGDITLGIHGMCGEKEFHYIFSYAKGFESLVSDGKEWLYRSPVPAFWRALTDNDRGNGFHIKSGMWMAADMFIRCIGIRVLADDVEIPMPTAPENNRYSGKEQAERMKIIYTYETITVPATTVQVSYEVEQQGKIRVTVHYVGKEGLPQLPVFGLRFLMPTCADKFLYEGLSGETYPDRMAGGVKGVYEVEGLPVTPYLVPQDCGMHMNTEWAEIYRSSQLDNTKKEKKMTALRFEACEKQFAFSCLPYTPCELENAMHHEELPLKRRTVFTVYGGVRGVGGIDSWGADVEAAYHLDAAKDMEFSFCILP